MANYNTDEPKERGFWYDVKITRKVSKFHAQRKWFHFSLFCRLCSGNNVILFAHMFPDFLHFGLACLSISKVVLNLYINRVNRQLAEARNSSQNYC